MERPLNFSDPMHHETITLLMFRGMFGEFCWIFLGLYH